MPRNNSEFFFKSVERQRNLSSKTKCIVEDVLSAPKKREKRDWTKNRVINAILSAHNEYIEALEKWENVKFNFYFFSKSRNIDVVTLTKKRESIFKNAFLDDDDKNWKNMIWSLKDLIDYALPKWPKKDEILKDFKELRKSNF